MRKPPVKKNTRFKEKNKTKLSARPMHRIAEKTFGTQSLDHDIPEEDRNMISNELPAETSSTENWSEPQDRGEDLAAVRDPFVQEPERDTQTPPELTQQAPEKTPEANENLADYFDAERESPPL